TAGANRVPDLLSVRIAPAPAGVARIEQPRVGDPSDGALVMEPHVLSEGLHVEIGRTIDVVVESGERTDRVRVCHVLVHTGIADAAGRALDLPGQCETRAQAEHQAGGRYRDPDPSNESRRHEGTSSGPGRSRHWHNASHWRP